MDLQRKRVEMVMVMIEIVAAVLQVVITPVVKELSSLGCETRGYERSRGNCSGQRSTGSVRPGLRGAAGEVDRGTVCGGAGIRHGFVVL
ncbi:hypothetical protein M0R45_030437 [Rubus argutus]|uniref:Secreted protein n=1 Tax=Rubus argutus TaxID=59490 RepID=A0AAW1WF31_RUBAR